MNAALHVLQYLKNEPALGILLSNNPTFDLLAYCDADWLLISILANLLMALLFFLAIL